MRSLRVVMLVSIVLCCAGAAVGQTEWVQHPDNPIIEPGEPGAWDDGGHYVNDVVFDGSTYHMWFAGLEASGYWWHIGHATSSDGVEWAMDPANPVLRSGEPGEWDDWGLSGVAVIHDGTQFHMWYTGWHGDVTDNSFRAGYATSPDGSVWTKYSGNPVMEVGPPGSWDDAGVSPAAVMVEGDTYRMWYEGAHGDGILGETRIGYAESSDGVHWTKRLEPVLELGTYPGTWDPQTVGNFDVVFDGATYHIWYTGGADTSTLTWLQIGYAFSSDGLEWTKHSGNPVVQSSDLSLQGPRVVFDGSTWHMWYNSWDGSVALVYYATSDCCAGVAGLTHSRFIPAAALASGAQGSYYQTDVDLSNAGGQPVQYQLMWLPRGETNFEPLTSETFSLGAGMSVRYANVLSEVFDLEPDSLGALALLSTSPDLLAMSRTYNMPSGEPAGTYGQAMPTILPGEFIRHGERRRILFGTENAEMRTNIGCQNASFGTMPVDLELFDMEGNSLGTKRMVLHPYSNDQINRIFEDFRPVSGYVEVWTPVSMGLFYCYGSVLDNVTSDPTTILPQ